ncbi:hypothetical protein QUF58_07255 [Anaerolineales bacterium HSG24]|nr:hypothetical protein [Anaerolineales bacterium HSG24]
MRKQTDIQLQFAICIQNEGSENLLLRKIYQILPDSSAAIDDYIRVIDDSGEDYLYPTTYFVQIKLPQKIEQLLLVM